MIYSFIKYIVKWISEKEALEVKEQDQLLD